MEECCFPASMLRLVISSASLNLFFSETFHDNFPAVRAKQVDRWRKPLRVMYRSIPKFKHSFSFSIDSLITCFVSKNIVIGDGSNHFSKVKVNVKLLRKGTGQLTFFSRSSPVDLYWISYFFKCFAIFVGRKQYYGSLNIWTDSQSKVRNTNQPETFVRVYLECKLQSRELFTVKWYYIGLT